MTQSLLKSFYKRLIAARSVNRDKARKEFILNILLIGAIVLTLFGFLVNIVDSSIYSDYNGLNPLISFSVLIFFCMLLHLSHKGKSEIAATIMVGLLFVLAVYASYHWGPDLSQALLLYALIIVIAGILTNSKISLFLTVAEIILVLLFVYLQINNFYKPDIRWKQDIIHFGDAVVYAITLGLMWILAWLSNREIEKSLQRARESERELKQERDLLEMKVEERTKELKLAQQEKVAQLYRFAEIGRLSSGLFHDLMTPLSLISLNLEQLKRKPQENNIDTMRSLLKRAIKGTRYLETSVSAFRKQLQNQESKKNFSLQKEIKQVVQLLLYKATNAEVKIIVDSEKEIKFYGNQMKFSQLITNLLLNAIDAYDGLPQNDNKREVTIRMRERGNTVWITVHDEGRGIRPENKKKIFQPFFTTKSSQKGTGIGLSISRDIVEKSFLGKIRVVSSKKTGTLFTLILPNSKKGEKTDEKLRLTQID